MRAIGKYVVIKPIKESNVKTTGGLILAEKQREDIRYRQALVIEPGTDVLEVDAGDEIYYDKSSGFSIELKNKEYKVIKENDIVVII
jgi:co-chaperonin GroES (HSP10)